MFNRPKVLAAVLALGLLAGAVAGEAPASASPLLHTMKIDATALSTDAINIEGVTSAPLPTSSPITVNVPTGTVVLNTGGGAFFCQPVVTAAGTWRLPAPCRGVASGSGTGTLTLSGRPITVDASHLSTGVDPLLYGNFVVHAGTSQTFTWMPQPPVEMVVGSGLPSRCAFGLATDGNATLARCGASAEVSGPQVSFVGFPFSFDARALSTDMYLIDALDLEAQTVTSASVHNYHLMAADGYTMQVAAGIVASFSWGIGATGRVYYQAHDGSFLSGYGTSTLVVKGLAATVNATGLGPGTFTLGPDIFGPSFDEATAQDLRLVPGEYELGASGLPAPEYFAWDLHNDGMAGFVSGDQHACAQAQGHTLYVDCSPATFTQLSSSADPADSGGTFTMTALECDRVADVDASGVMTFVDVTTGTTLGSRRLSPSTAYANCGQAQVTDSETLGAGTYVIKAVYRPAGTTAVPTSAPATYSERIVLT